MPVNEGGAGRKFPWGGFRGPVFFLALAVAGFDPVFAQDRFAYEDFARHADLLWATRDRVGFEKALRTHRACFHRYFVRTEMAWLRADSQHGPSLAGRLASLGRFAGQNLGTEFYASRAKQVTAARAGEREKLLWAWRGHPPPGLPVLDALVAVEQVRQALQHEPPHPLPAAMRTHLRQLRKARCVDGELDGLLLLGIWYLQANQLVQGQNALQSAERLDRRIHGGRGSEIALNLGRLDLKREDFPAARTHFAVAVASSSGLLRVTARAHLAQAHAFVLDLDQAVREARLVERELESVPLMSLTARGLILIRLSDVDVRRGAFHDALVRIDRAEKAIVRAEGADSRRLLLARRQRAYIHMVMGEFEKAGAELAEGLTRARALGDGLEETYYLRFLAELAYRTGQEGLTLQRGLETIAAARKAHAGREVVIAQRLLGKVNLRWGLLEDASLYLRDALDRVNHLAMPRWRREIVRDLLYVLDRQGRFEDAKHYETLLRSDLQNLPPVEVVKDSLLLARLARERGEAERAAQDLQRAQEVLVSFPAATPDPTVLWLKGASAIEAAEQSDDPEDVIDLLDEAVEFARTIKDPILEAGALSRKAARLSAMGDLEKARDALEEAYALGSQSLDTTGHLPLRAGFFEKSREVLGQLAGVTLELEERGKEPDDASRILRLAEEFRDRRFRTEWTHFAGPAVHPRIQRLKGELEDVLSLYEAVDQLDATGRKSLHERLTSIRDEYHRLTNEAWQERPRVDPRQLDIGALRTRLGPDLLLEYVLGKNQAFVIAVGRKEGVKVLRLKVNVKTLEGRVRYLDTFMQRLRIGHEHDYARPTRTLYDDLVKPVVDAGLLPPGRPVIMAPDRALERLPFHALVIEPVEAKRRIRFRDLTYLIQRNPLRYVTAAGDLLANEPYDPSGIRARFLGVAPGEAVTGLPGAIREVETLGALFPPDRRALALRTDAAEDRLMSRPDLGTFPILHFATHGRASALYHAYSGLWLGTGDEGKSDGVLHGFEVALSGLKPGLVVLSACASGRDIAAPGITGVGWGRVFLDAGARAVVLSVWQVDDRVTPVFMEAFYRGLLAGETADRALARAACSLLERTDADYWANPRYWAPYILVGEAVRFQL